MHTEEILPAKDATCKETGLTEGKVCSVCGDILVAQTEIPATGDHKYVGGKCEYCGELQTDDFLKGYTISLGGNIAVNFYMALDDEMIDENTKVVFTLPNGSKKSVYAKNATVTDEGYYVFTCEVAAKEMADTIKAQLITSAGALNTYEYSVKDYADYILASDNAMYEAAKPLVKAMLNYGAYAQVFFNYNLKNLANGSLSDAEKVLEKAELSKHSYKLEGNESGVKYHGSRLTLESETAVKHYFSFTDAENIPTIKVNGKGVVAQKKGDLYEVKISDIPAQKLDGEIVVEIGNLKLEYNALSYGHLVLQGNDLKLQDVINALYAYNQAADAYIVDAEG